MIEAVGSGSLEHTLELYDRFHEAHRAGPAEASPDNISAFEAEMNHVEASPHAGEEIQIAQAGQVDSWIVTPPTPAGTGPVEQPATIGDRILDTFTDTRDAWDRSQNMDGLLSEGVTPMGLIQMQYNMSVATVSVTTLSNGIHALTQKLDGLLKTG